MRINLRCHTKKVKSDDGRERNVTPAPFKKIDPADVNVINSVTYGVKMPRVGTDTMSNLLISLPSISEQKRIFAKLEEIMPLCERLKKEGTS